MIFSKIQQYFDNISQIEKGHCNFLLPKIFRKGFGYYFLISLKILLLFQNLFFFLEAGSIQKISNECYYLSALDIYPKAQQNWLGNWMKFLEKFGENLLCFVKIESIRHLTNRCHQAGKFMKKTPKVLRGCTKKDNSEKSLRIFEKTL